MYEMLQMEFSVAVVSSVGLLTANLKFNIQDSAGRQHFSLLGTKFCKEVFKESLSYL